MDVGDTTNRLGALASRIGVSDTIREPARDIEAQLRALNDPRHPKTAVFLARGTPLGTRRLAANVRVITRAEGTLLTTDKKRADYYRAQATVTDDDLAHLLGYPETKADVLAQGEGIVVQARDAHGCVITEALASPHRASETMRALEQHVPFCGQLIVLTPAAALTRRLRGG
jgi:hypothetical protein